MNLPKGVRHLISRSPGVYHKDCLFSVCAFIGAIVARN